VCPVIPPPKCTWIRIYLHEIFTHSWLIRHTVSSLLRETRRVLLGYRNTIALGCIIIIIIIIWISNETLKYQEANGFYPGCWICRSITCFYFSLSLCDSSLSVTYLFLFTNCHAWIALRLIPQTCYPISRRTTNLFGNMNIFLGKSKTFETIWDTEFLKRVCPSHRIKFATTLSGSKHFRDTAL